MKNIVVVGAGYAGILIAKKLEKKLKKDAHVHIVVIDQNPFHTMLTELHEVAACRVEEDSIRIDYAKVFAGRRVHFVQDYVESVDFEQKTVQGKKGAYAYDYVVIAAGSKPTYFGVPGAEEFTYPLWSFQDAVRLKTHIHTCFVRASEALDENEKRRLLSFYVVGAGFTGVEMVGELAEYVPILCDRYQIDPALVSLCNVDALPRVVPNLPEKLSAKIQRRLEKMGVHVILGAKVTEIGDGYIVYSKDDTPNRHTAGTVIWVAGIESAAITQKAGEYIPNQRRGRLDADPYLRSVKDSSIYIAGDNLCYIPEGETMPVPQMVENCEQSADVVAHNLYCAVTGRGEMKQYRPKFHGVMVCVGGRYGAARVGTPKHMVNLPSFLAMFCKHFINIVYFAQVLGWNKIFSYMKHEFFTIRHKRSFVGGHFSNRTPSFLLVPLRLWLGAVWVFEGIMKLIGGWLNTPKLDAFFGGAAAWFDAIVGAGAVDGTSAATAAAAESAAKAGHVIFDVDFLGFIRAIFVSGKPLAESTIADYAFKLDIPLLNSFLHGFVLSNPGVMLLMQSFVVFTEILIGLSLMGGLLTTLSAFVSLILLAMFASTTGLFLSSFWMVFGAIAVLIGGGQIFGLDYYVSPLLKRGWRNIGWVRRLYFYHD